MERHPSLNIHIGEILKYDIIEPCNITITEAARKLDVTRLTLSKIINGKSGITPNMALRISYVFGGTPEFWLRLQQKYELTKEKENLNFQALEKVE